MASEQKWELYATTFIMNIITPFKSAAPLSGSIKDFTIFSEIKSSKKGGACALFCTIIFIYKTYIFQRKENCTLI